MDKRHLQYDILEKKYNSSAWKEVMIQVFSAIRLYQQPVSIPLPANEIVENALELGSFYTQDERLVGIYELTLKPDSRTKIAYNKVGLRNLLRKVYKYDVDGALIVFIQGERWRFSYVSEIRIQEGKKETEPKRFTYLFGKGEICRTAAERFYSLIGKPIKLDDLFEAFNVDKLNKDFFKGYKEFYQRGVRHLVETKSYYKLLIDNNEKEEQSKQKPIRDFVKKLLGRIVFLHFLQKKGWMGVPANNKNWKGGDKHFMQKLFAENDNKSKFYSECLKFLFFKTLNTKRNSDLFLLSLSPKREPVKIPFLNGGLFDKDLSFENDIDFPAEYFAQLFDFFEQYNFTIDENDPYESEVGIDPEMLGHIFENLLEENKEKGAFYTPKEVVHFMCQECLIEYLKSNINLPEEAILSFIRNNEVDKKLTQHETARHIEALLKTVKVCDPAIGSGAFPMGMLKEIFECRRLIYPYLKITDAFDPAKVKKEIIKNNIYGVDIEPGAVDIARLRFWLALVVDEDTPEPLPNLDYKIMQGNSLLERFDGIDLSKIAEADDNVVVSEKNQIILPGMGGNMQTILVFDNVTKRTLYTLIEKFFDPEEWEKTHNEKVDKEKIKRQINDIVEGAIHAEVIEEKLTLEKSIKNLEGAWKKVGVSIHEMNLKSKEVKQYNQLKERLEHLDAVEEQLVDLQKTNHKPFFLWHLFFKDVFDKGGFDIVIGNPPYIQLQKMGEEADALEAANYKSFTRTGDIYCLFYEQGNNLLKQGGILSYITSNKWMNAAYGKNFRKYLLAKTNPILLIDFSKTVIFPAAVVFVNILNFKKEANQNKLLGVKAQADFQIGKTKLNIYVKETGVVLSDINEDSWTVAEKRDFQITSLMEEAGLPLKEWNLKFFRGVTTGLNEVFHINKSTKEHLIAEDRRSEELIKPLLRGKDIKRYKYAYEDIFIIFTKHGTSIEQYPAIKTYLSQFKKELTPKKSAAEEMGRKPGVYKWFEIQDNTAYYPEFEKEKVVWIEISDRANYCLDTKGHYLTNSAYFLTGQHLKYLLGVLNSKLMDFYFYQKTAQIAGGRKRYTKQYVELLPIIRLENEELRKKYETIVDYLIYLNDETKAAVNPYTTNSSIAPVFEDVLNMMVYELYFEEHMRGLEIDVLKYLDMKREFKVLDDDDEKSLLTIRNAYNWLQSRDNPIRSRIILSNIRSKDIISRINSTTL